MEQVLALGFVTSYLFQVLAAGWQFPIVDLSFMTNAKVSARTSAA